jgi:DNA-binding response OmpR family regulator
MSNESLGDGPANPRILLAEDEALIAMDLAMELETRGAEIVGPVKDLAAALRAAASERLDGAILDVDLRGELVYPAAEILLDRGIPFVFHSGRSRWEDTRMRFPTAPALSKPSSCAILLSALFGRRTRLA